MSTSELKPLPSGGKAIAATRVLADLVRQLGPGAKLPTVRDLCKQMQVSRYTLDTALDDLTLQGLLQRKHGSGLYASPMARTQRIGLVVRRDLLEFAPDNNDFNHLFFRALRRDGRRRDELLTCYGYDPEHDRDKHGPQQLELDVQNGRVDAVIVGGMSYAQLQEVVALGVPCVFLTGNTYKDNFAPRVITTMSSAIGQGVRALVQSGRRRIGLAYAVFPDQTAYGDYLAAFQQAVREEGAEADFHWLMPFDANTLRYRPLEASRLFHTMWTGSTARPDGLLSLDDTYTSGVLHAMELLGVRAPQDLLVVSQASKGLELFDNAEVIRLEFDPEELSRVVLQTVDDVLAGKPVAPVQTIPVQLRRPEAATVHAD